MIIDDWMSAAEAATSLGVPIGEIYRLVDERRLPAFKLGDQVVIPRAVGRSAEYCHTLYHDCMTMLSFRVDDDTATRAQMWADRLGLDRSALLRDALRRHLLQLASESDAETWADNPLEEGELALAEISDWGPADEWSDWADATR